jgi:hypothetical protein
LTAASAILKQGELRAQQLTAAKEMLLLEEEKSSHREHQANEAEEALRCAELILAKVSSFLNQGSSQKGQGESLNLSVSLKNDDAESSSVANNPKLVDGGISFDLCREIATSPYAFHVLNKMTV